MDRRMHGQNKGGVGDVPPRWDLRDLYASSQAPEISRDLDGLRTASASFAGRYQGKLAGLDGAELAAAIASFEDISVQAARLQSFAALTRAADRSQSAFAQKLESRTREALKPSGFFTAELNAMTEADLFEKMAAPELAARGSWLGRIRSLREHQLDPALEHYLEDKTVFAENAWSRLHGMTLATLSLEVGGKTRTAAETLHLMNNGADETTRHEAFEAYTKALTRKKETFTLIFNTLANLRAADDERRGFESPEDSRHLANRIDAAAVETMMGTVRGAYAGTAHRYYEWKARRSGRARLHPADRNAPLAGAAQEGGRRFTWGEAKVTVLEAFEGFSPDFARLARRFFEEGWIDAEPRAGKAGGAFCMSTVPEAHPYISMNFFGTARDVQVLAHELGHGVHQMLAAEKGFFGAETPLTMAETASVFAEGLVFRHLLAQEQDPCRQRDMLAAWIEDRINTVVRQSAFYTFEQRFYAEHHEKGDLSAERISTLWLETQKEALGPFVKMDAPGAETLWMPVPHFIHAPFYVYAYVFGDGLVRSLAAAHEKAADQEEFKKKYLDLLRAGGTKSHETALKPFGLDIHAAAFWQEGVAMLVRDIDALLVLDQSIGDTPSRKADFNAAAEANDNAPQVSRQQKKRRDARPSGPAGGA